MSLIIAQALERSRFGTWLVAVRENEDAAMALGVNATAIKVAAMTISAAITAAAGCFYVQYFLFVDAPIGYGAWISIEALLTPIIGGAGTVFGALIGALAVKSIGEGAKFLTGDIPGLDLMTFGAVLVLVIAFAPRGLVGTLIDGRDVAWHAASCPCENPRRERRMADPLLSVEGVSRGFGGLMAVNGASLHGFGAADNGVDRSEWRRQDHALFNHLRLSQAERRARDL